MTGERLARPQGAQELGLTDLIWDMTLRCWHQDPALQPTMVEVVGLVREWSVLSLSPWNEYHNIFPAATELLLCGLGLQTSQSSS